jgi:hypothetical protein
MEVIRFDFNGSSNDFKRTPQGFLRVNARLTKTGIFSYETGREYRSEEEVFREDSLASFKGAPVTDLHPSEKGFESFLTPANVKQHIIGITESIERDGSYLKGSLIIFHEDSIKAIEAGERKEISLGYKCELDPTPGIWNGEAYDAAQKSIIVNHVAIGPKGWGRAGPDCSIRTDSSSTQGNSPMTETLHFDGVDIALTPDAVLAILSEKKRQYEEAKGRLDGIGLELEKAQAAKAALENPKTIEAKVQSRLKLIEKCRRILGHETIFDGKTDDELKLLVIKKFHPNIDLSDKDQSYSEGMFEALIATNAERNDSLTSARKTIHQGHNTSNLAYEKWLEHSARMWTMPLTGSLRYSNE